MSCGASSLDDRFETVSQAMSRSELLPATEVALTKRPGKRSKAANSPNVSLFIANLRLLDLDLRGDWPDIIPNDFDTRDAQQSQKRRTTCVEWSLYRLFELWDPSMTRDKLRPFFPPLEPLQSLNLRAALFRCLSDQKKNGALGREATLRKTMLDDCKGDKLEELLLSFSATVLRKYVAARSQRFGVSVAQRIGTGIIQTADVVRNTTPLLIAHRVALTAFLERRHLQTRRIEHLTAELEANRQLVERGHAQVARDMQALRATVPSKQADRITQQVHEGWIGGPGGSRGLLEGDVPAIPAYTQSTTFHDLWLQTLDERPNSHQTRDLHPLTHLSYQLEQQSARLKQWRKYRFRVAPTNEPSHINGVASRSPEFIGKLRFESHIDIGYGDGPQLADLTEHAPYASRAYDSIVKEMRTALAAVGKFSRQSAFADGRTLETHTDTKESLERPIVTAVGETAQNLNAVLFSPVKRGPTSIDDPTIERMSTSVPSGEHLGDLEQDGQELTQHDGSDAYVARKASEHSSPPLLTVDLDRYQDAVSASPQIDQNSTPMPTSMQARYTRQTLTERTRMSMDADGDGESTPSPTLPIHWPHGTDKKSEMAQDTIRSRNSMSLADATRNSIAVAIARQQKDDKQRNVRHQRSRSSLYPINQFDTPIKAKRDVQISSTDDSKTPTRRDVTPLAALLSEDAQYASVFKSRPKIATSPVQPTLR